MMKVNFSGSYYDIGFQLGNQIKNFFQLPPTSKETIVFAQECRPHIKKYSPGILEELQGLCDATDFDSKLLDAFILALGRDKINQARELFKKGVDFGCTSFAIKSSHTGLGTALFAQNYDWTESFREYFTVVWNNPKNGIANLSFTDHIVGRYGGMNRAGLAMSIHGIPSYKKEWAPGLRMNVISRWVLDNMKTTKDVIKYIEEIPHVCGHNFLICDRNDDIVRIETAGDKVVVTQSENGFMGITNQYESKNLKKYEFKNFKFRNSEIRLNKINKWFKKNNPEITIEKIKELLSAHDDGVCNHFEFGEEITSTIWSWIAKIRANEILVCDGAPCTNNYDLLKL